MQTSWSSARVQPDRGAGRGSEMAPGNMRGGSPKLLIRAVRPIWITRSSDQGNQLGLCAGRAFQSWPPLPPVTCWTFPQRAAAQPSFVSNRQIASEGTSLVGRAAGFRDSLFTLRDQDISSYIRDVPHVVEGPPKPDRHPAHAWSAGQSPFAVRTDPRAPRGR